jgi:hypothetical protein
MEPGIYEHYKGKRYEVIGLARHTETEEDLVVYKALYEGNFPKDLLWVRPLKMFQEQVSINGQFVPRFRKILSSLLLFFLTGTLAWAAPSWEKQGNFYYLAKNDKQHFSAPGAGPNTFESKYVSYNKVDFLVRGKKEWKDYGRLNLGGNNLFIFPIKPGTKVEEIHFLAGGNYGNSYKEDFLLKLYGENYYYGTISLTFVYQDNTYRGLSVPIFWDWFHLGLGAWKREGAQMRSLGENPVRPKCNMYLISFTNPRPQEPLQAILLNDSWVQDLPYSDIFALTIKSSDSIEALPRENK